MSTILTLSNQGQRLVFSALSRYEGIVVSDRCTRLKEAVDRSAQPLTLELFPGDIEPLSEALRILQFPESPESELVRAHLLRGLGQVSLDDPPGELDFREGDLLRRNLVGRGKMPAESAMLLRRWLARFADKRFPTFSYLPEKITISEMGFSAIVGISQVAQSQLVPLMCHLVDHLFPTVRGEVLLNDVRL